MRRYLLPLVALLACTAMVFAACGDDDDDASASAAPGGNAGALLAALTVIDGAGFHGMDDTLNKPGGKIDPQWAGRSRHALVAARAVSWPAELQTEAKAFADACSRLVEALEKDDAAGGAKPAKEAHDSQHDLSNKAWAMLGAQAGVKASGAH